MARVTPPIGATGLFLLRMPFVASTTLAYHVGALRTFEELITRGIDPVTLVYSKAGLGPAQYQEDLAAGALIVTLLSPTQAPLYVPDTYIDSYPNMGVVPHNWMVATISLGMLPDTYDTTRLAQAITQAVSEYTGVEAAVQLASAPVTDAITQEQYVQNLNARTAAIKNRSTTYADLLNAQATITNLTQTNAALIELITQLQQQVADLKGSAPA